MSGRSQLAFWLWKWSWLVTTTIDRRTNLNPRYVWVTYILVHISHSHQCIIYVQVQVTHIYSIFRFKIHVSAQCVSAVWIAEWTRSTYAVIQSIKPINPFIHQPRRTRARGTRRAQCRWGRWWGCRSTLACWAAQRPQSLCSEAQGSLAIGGAGWTTPQILRDTNKRRWQLY